MVDSLPLAGPGWACDFVKIEGDERDDAGNCVIEEVELWRRDALECVKDLISNPAFRSVMKYAPERVYRDKNGKIRVYGETWSADWWWQLQVCSYDSRLDNR